MLEQKFPVNIFNDSMVKLKEIFIWNRALTDLNKNQKIINIDEFLNNELIEIKGPYVEYVARPKLDDMEFNDFCKKIGIDDTIRKTFENVLFKKITNKRLYKHQTKFIESVKNTENNDVTLAVPTASGKTEAFLLPILDECIKNKNDQLKALIFYPSKTLAIDQFNRIIKYVYEVNRLNSSYNITIGIWDGDTQYEVTKDDTNYKTIKTNSLIRGIRCPECSSKLKIKMGEIIYCEECEFQTSWIKATRKSIMNGVNILLTNPEAFDFLFVDPDPKKVKLIGQNSSYNKNLKFVVFDEAHSWTGASGSAIHMLCERLRFFYSKEIKFFVISATISNPEFFGEKLTGRKNLTIQFEPEIISYRKDKVDVSKIPPILPGLALNILYIDIFNKDEKIALSSSEEKNAIGLLELLGYYKDSKLEEEIQVKFYELGKIKSFEQFVSNQQFVDDLKTRIIANLPEILLLREFLSKREGEPITFTSFDKIVNDFVIKLDKKNVFSEKNATIVANSLLTLGRIGGLLQDRLHYFIRGNEGIFYCSDCKLISGSKICDKCKRQIQKQLMFCSTCHNVFYTENNSIDYELENTSNLFDLATDTKVESFCLNCENNVSKTFGLRDGSIFHPQLLSQFLSAYGRISPSNKILVFADGRNLAEKIGNDFVSNDYRIVSQRYMHSLLSKNPVEAFELYRKTLEFIDKKFYYPILESLKDKSSKKIWKDYRENELKHFASLRSATMLIEGCLITPSCIIENLRSDLEAFLAHILFKKLIKSGKFTRKKVNFNGFILEKIYDLDLKISVEDINKSLPIILKTLFENNVISFEKKEIIESKIDSEAKNDEDKKYLKEYFNLQTRDLNEILHKINFTIPDECYGIFDLKYRIETYDSARKNDFILKRIDQVSLCKICKKGFPSIEGNIKICPECNGNLINGDRSKNNGYLPELTSLQIPFDYWCKEINTDKEKDIKTLAISVHRAGIPQELRSVIEDNFKQKNPLVNIISATTTFELGIDIGDLDTIFLVGLPPGVSNYIQRSGRAGRSIGHSSMIVTFIRAGNVIDDYYFEDLENRYFSSMPYFGIPKNEDVEVIFASHLVTLISAYLARNYDQNNTYKKIWDVNYKTFSLSKFISQNNLRMKLFSILISKEKKEEINKIIEEINGETGIELLKNIISEEHDYSILKRVRDHFKYYKELRLSKDSQNKIAESFRFLSQLLSSIGYLANYRGFIESMPLQSKSDILEEKSLIDIVKENYPGFKNNVEDGKNKIGGGSTYISMTPYFTDKVYVSKMILDTKICNNKECTFYYIKADKNLDECIICGEDLRRIRVFAPEEVKIKKLQSDFGFKSYPSLVQDIEFQSYNPIEISISKKLTINGFNTIANLILFVPSYSYRFRNSSEWKVKLSQAEIFEDIDYEGLYDEIDTESMDELLEAFEEKDEKSKKYVPIGYSLYTRASAFDLSFLDILGKKDFDEEIQDDEKIKLAVFESTFEQVLKKSISLVIGCNTNEFTVLSIHIDNHVRFVVADNSEGGNGISDSVFSNLNEIIKKSYEVVNCKHCNKYCKRCVLIERTPNYLLKNDLLDRYIVKEILERIL